MCSGRIHTNRPPMIRVSGLRVRTITVESSGVRIELTFSV
jgi:hypothetical protein